MFLIGFPLLIIPLAIYNMIVFLTPGVMWTDKITTIHLLSNIDWTVTFGDALIFLSLFLLLVEIAKASRVAGKSIVDHVLSFVVLAIATGELIFIDKAATSTFAIVAAICLVDFLSGFAASRRTASPKDEMGETVSATRSAT